MKLLPLLLALAVAQAPDLSGIDIEGLEEMGLDVSQLLNPGAPRMDRPEAVAADVSLVQHQVCPLVCRFSEDFVNKVRSTSRRKQKLREDEIDSLLVPHVCDPKKPAGEWLTQYAFVEVDFDNDLYKIDLERRSESRRVDAQVMTLHEACLNVLNDGSGDVDLVEKIYMQKNLDEIVQAVCVDNPTYKRRVEGSRAQLKVSISERPKIGDVFEKRTEMDEAMLDINEAIRSDPSLNGEEL